jgi:hypothetical protein
MRTEPTKAQMREKVAENIDGISKVAREGNTKLGKGYVWVQFLYKEGEWLMRAEFITQEAAMKLGMRADTMQQIEEIGKFCDPAKGAAVLIFKGDNFHGGGVVGLSPRPKEP